MHKILLVFFTIALKGNTKYLLIVCIRVAKIVFFQCRILQTLLNFSLLLFCSQKTALEKIINNRPAFFYVRKGKFKGSSIKMDVLRNLSNTQFMLFLNAFDFFRYPSRFSSTKFFCTKL